MTPTDAVIDDATTPETPTPDAAEALTTDNAAATTPDDADASETPDAITKLLNARRLSELLTNDAGRIVARYSELNSEGNAYVTRLADISGEAPRRITGGSQSIGPAALADDGTLWFASKRPGDDGAEAESPSLWALVEGAEARKVGDHDGGFSRIEVAGDRLVVQFPVHTWASDEAEHAEWAKERTDAKVTGILHSGFPVRRWDHDLGPARETIAVAAIAGPDAPAGLADDFADTSATLDFRHLTMPAGRLVDWAVDEAGTFVLVQVEKPIEGQLEASELWTIDLDGDAAPRLLVAAAPDHSYGIAAISPDGTRAVIVRETFWTPAASLSVTLELLDLATGDHTPLWPEGDRWYDPIWIDGTRLAATADEQGRGSVVVGDVTDPAPTLLVGGTGQRFAFSGLKLRAGTVLATASAIDVVPHPVSIDLGTGEITELASPATVVASTGTLAEVEAAGEDGTPIRAWLALPEGSGPHPLIVFAHGGPWGSWNAWTYRWNPGPFVDAGYAVLLPDPAISTGYGQAMIDRGQQQLGGAPFTDIMALTDATIARNDIDAEHTALAGGSYGGYMANWVAGHTGDRFKCIVTHASLWNTFSMGRTTDNSSWDTAMREQSAQYSPHLFAEGIEVPMLVIHGDHDYRVPIGQGQELWYDLLQRSATPLDEEGRTQHRFLYFPNEGHWITGRGNSEVWYRTFLAFMDKHVRGAEVERARTLG